MTEQLSLFGSWLPEKPNEKLSFHDWQIREGDVLYRCGVSQMSTTHLLAHLVRNQKTAERIMERFGSLTAVAEASVAELKQVEGVGVAVAEMIRVACEFSRRIAQLAQERRPEATHPRQVYDLLRDELMGLKQEVLKVLLLDTKNRVEHTETVFVGTLNCSVIHPREIFRLAIRQSACAIIVAHNHPSGTTAPSEQDIRATKQIAQAGEHIQIQLLDHVIIGKEGYFSMKEEGML